MNIKHLYANVRLKDANMCFERRSRLFAKPALVRISQVFRVFPSIVFLSIVFLSIVFSFHCFFFTVFPRMILYFGYSRGYYRGYSQDYSRGYSQDYSRGYSSSDCSSCLKAMTCFPR